jgi:hypothetical protein
MSILLLSLMGTAGAASSDPMASPAVVGDWNGAISTGGSSLRVIVHVAQDKDSKLTATMDSPDQGANGIAISSITFEGAVLHFEITRFGAAFSGTMNKDLSEIAGDWKQGSASFPLTFKRAIK